MALRLPPFGYLPESAKDDHTFRQRQPPQWRQLQHQTRRRPQLECGRRVASVTVWLSQDQRRLPSRPICCTPTNGGVTPSIGGSGGTLGIWE